MRTSHALRAHITEARSIAHLREVAAHLSDHEFQQHFPGYQREPTTRVMAGFPHMTPTMAPWQLGFRNRFADLMDLHHLQAAQVDAPELPAAADPIAVHTAAMHRREQRLLTMAAHETPWWWCYSPEGDFLSASRLTEAVRGILTRGHPFDRIQDSPLRLGIEQHMRMTVAAFEAEATEDDNLRTLGDDEGSMRVNVYTGELIQDRSSHLPDLQAHYRYARQFFQIETEQPLLAPLSDHERATIVRAATRLSAATGASDFDAALALLKTHGDTFSLAFRQLLTASRPEEMRALIDAYFGLYPQRVFEDTAAAFHFVRAMAATGYDREVGHFIGYDVENEHTAAHLLQQGTTGQVRGDSELFCLCVIHSHPPASLCESLPLDADLIRQFARDADVRGKTTYEGLFSDGDLRTYIDGARVLFRMTTTPQLAAFPRLEESALLYDARRRVFSSWVTHQYMDARAQVHMNERGAVTHVDVHFALNDRAPVGDRAYQLRIDRVTAHVADLRLPIRFHRMDDHQELVDQMPPLPSERDVT